MNDENDETAHREAAMEAMRTLAGQSERGLAKLPPPTSVRDYRALEAIYRAVYRTAGTPQADAVLDFADQVERDFRKTGKTSVEFQASNEGRLIADDWRIKWLRENETALESLGRSE